MDRPPCIAIPFKQTSEVDWVRALKRYISTQYQEDPEAYSEDCNRLQRMRQDMRGAGPDNTGRDLIYRYYTHLETLEPRFPVNEQGVKVAFKWTDPFTHETTLQHSLAFEKASVLFNLGAAVGMHAATLYSDAAVDPESESLVLACTYFQIAADRFHYISENFLHAPSLDLQQESVNALCNAMHAQSQECVVEKARLDGKKDATLSKLAQQAVLAYATLCDSLRPAMDSHQLPRGWQQLAETKLKYYMAYVQYHEGRANDAKGKHGMAIARLQQAETLLREATRLVGEFSDSFFATQALTDDLNTGSAQGLAEAIKSMSTKAADELKQMNRDNDMVYNESIPSFAALPAVEGANVVAPMKIDSMYSPDDLRRIVGPDLFERLIPMSVHESSSMYSEEKAKLIRTEDDKVNLADGELQAALAFMQMPDILYRFKRYLAATTPGNKRSGSGGFIAELAEPSADVRDLAQGVSIQERTAPLTEVRATLDAQRTRVKDRITELSQMLDQEQQASDQVLAEYSADPAFAGYKPSVVASQFFRDVLLEQRRSFENGTAMDRTIFDKYRQLVAPWLPTLQNGAEGVTSALLEQLKDIDFGGVARADGGETLLDVGQGQPVGLSGHVQTVQDTLEQLDEVKKQRHTTLRDLKSVVKDDDIAGTLMKSASGKELQQLFNRELQKFDAYTQRLQSTMTRQQQLVKRLSDEFRTMMESPEARRVQEKWDLAEQRKATVEAQLLEAVQTYKIVAQGMNSGAEYYKNMYSILERPHKDLLEYIEGRASQREQLVKRARQEKAAREQAALRERLNQYAPPPAPAAQAYAQVPQNNRAFEVDHLADQAAQMTLNAQRANVPPQQHQLQYQQPLVDQSPQQQRYHPPQPQPVVHSSPQQPMYQPPPPPPQQQQQQQMYQTYSQPQQQQQQPVAHEYHQPPVHVHAHQAQQQPQPQYQPPPQQYAPPPVAAQASAPPPIATQGYQPPPPQQQQYVTSMAPHQYALAQAPAVDPYTSTASRQSMENKRRTNPADPNFQPGYGGYGAHAAAPPAPVPSATNDVYSGITTGYGTTHAPASSSSYAPAPQATHHHQHQQQQPVYVSQAQVGGYAPPPFAPPPSQPASYNSTVASVTQPQYVQQQQQQQQPQQQYYHHPASVGNMSAAPPPVASTNMPYSVPIQTAPQQYSQPPIHQQYSQPPHQHQHQQYQGPVQQQQQPPQQPAYNPYAYSAPPTTAVIGGPVPQAQPVQPVQSGYAQQPQFQQQQQQPQYSHGYGGNVGGSLMD